MTPIVHTARISYAGADRFDVTRKSGGPDGHPFAPSWAILRPALDARKRHRLGATGSAVAFEVGWAVYCRAYRAEMRDSYVANRAAWDALLARESVTLVCYCTDATHCHRMLLAGTLGKLGADVRGERTTEPRTAARGEA